MVANQEPRPDSKNPFRYKCEIMPSNSNDSHIQMIYMVPHASKVLDVGCACGDLGSYLFKHKKCVVYGIEYEADSAATAKATGGYADIAQIDLNKFETLPTSFPETFDRIIFGDVLEHLIDPMRVLKAFLPWLGENGRLIISLPNIAHGSIIRQLLENTFEYMELGVLDKTHLRFFTHKTISVNMAALGLQIVSTAKTIVDLPGFPPYTATRVVPRNVLAFIASNLHSYVLQYIFEANRSEQSTQDLEQTNLRYLEEFTEEEQARIAAFRRATWPYNSDISGTLWLIFHDKPWLKQHVPRPLWNFLKQLRNMVRR